MYILADDERLAEALSWSCPALKDGLDPLVLARNVLARLSARNTPKTLAEIFRDAGLKTRSYSGRGMYGAKCLAVLADGVGELLAAVAKDPASAHWAEELEAMREDGMGRSSVFYFPDVDPPEAEEDDEDSDGEDEDDND